MNDGKPCAKVGREYRPNPRLSRSGSHERDEAHALEALALEPARGALDDVEPLVAGLHRDDEPARPRRAAPSSAVGMSSPAAAATLIASNGAVSGSPRAPSPTTSVTLSIPRPRGCAAPARTARRGARRSTRARRGGEQRGVVARAGADVEDPLVAPQLEQLEHPRDDERLGDRLAGADRQRHVVPGLARRAPRGTNSSRGTSRIASQHALVGDVPAELIDQPVRRRAHHATTPPAARTSASARSESPGSISTPRTALLSTVTAKPARSASSAVFLTQ